MEALLRSLFGFHQNSQQANNPDAQTVRFCSTTTLINEWYVALFEQFPEGVKGLKAGIFGSLALSVENPVLLIASEKILS